MTPAQASPLERRVAEPADGRLAHLVLPLDLETRVACQAAIEGVYWQHRLWPEANPSARPPLEAVLPAEVIRARVEDQLRQAEALAAVWQAPITGEQLQAEVERLARSSRQPERLQEIFSVLGNDPGLIAECLARPLLVERLIDSWYAHDERFHGEVAARARDELSRISSADQMAATSGEYSDVAWVRGESPAGDGSTLGPEEWDAQRRRLARLFNSPANQIPLGQVSALQEDSRRFYAVAVLEQSADRLRVVTVEWHKQPFDGWWASVRGSFTPQSPSLSFEYRLPEITAAQAPNAGADDTWAPTPYLPDSSSGTAVWTGSEMIVWGGAGPFGGKSLSGSRYNPATDTWTTLTTINAPLERNNHTAVWTGTEMIVWGGCGPFDLSFCTLNSGGRYNPATDTWNALSTTGAPAGRIYHTAVWTGSQMIVWGGCTDAEHCTDTNTGGVYDYASDSWTATSLAGAPASRYYHTAVWSGSEMVVWGGYDGIFVLGDGARYNLATNTWQPISLTNAPGARAKHTAVWTGSEMIVWAGCDSSVCEFGTGTMFNTGGRYNPGTNSWTATSLANAPSPRANHTAIWTGSEMIVYGGTSGTTTLNTGGRYNPASDSWTATNTLNATARTNHRAVWTGTLMLVWGGVSRTGERYDPASNSWTPMNSADPDSWRAYHTTVWTGSEMIAWGGEDTPNGSAFGSGVVYNPATASFRDTSLTGAPGGRIFHTAVWTGSEMIVWGGQNGTTTFRNGGRYNPASDSWTATSTTGAPATRGNHSAVWTGTEMIVWGGSGNTFYMNSGGRYNPTTNTWTATPTTGAPLGRYIHTAVWSGSEMIVWGGYSATGDTNTGGRYNPSTNAWTATSTANAPVGRHYHTPLWTGTEMVVWGGLFGTFDSPTYLNSGGRYDPAANLWTATSLAGAPSVRARHTAVWTGTEMIVWGGCTGSTSCGDSVYTGGRYDPSSDTWRATSNAGSPSARSLHTAVWTGSDMIVWGGWVFTGGYTGSGAHYFASGGGGGDTTPPAISGVSATGVTSSTATINWSTDEAATSQVEYGLTTSYGSATPLDASLVTSHSVSLAGLAASTVYHYRVRSSDAAGNESVSGDLTFTTSAGPAADTVTVTRASYDTARQRLTVSATSTNASAVLTVYVTSTDALIGTLTNNGGGSYSGRLTWSANPVNITVRSSLGGSASAAVRAR